MHTTNQKKYDYRMAFETIAMLCLWAAAFCLAFTFNQPVLSLLFVAVGCIGFFTVIEGVYLKINQRFVEDLKADYGSNFSRVTGGFLRLRLVDEDGREIARTKANLSGGRHVVTIDGEEYELAYSKLSKQPSTANQQDGKKGCCGFIHVRKTCESNEAEPLISFYVAQRHDGCHRFILNRKEFSISAVQSFLRCKSFTIASQGDVLGSVRELRSRPRMVAVALPMASENHRHLLAIVCSLATHPVF